MATDYNIEYKKPMSNKAKKIVIIDLGKTHQKMVKPLSIGEQDYSYSLNTSTHQKVGGKETL